MGHPKNGFLDQEEYEPLFAVAEELNAPIYLHPSPIQSDVYQAYYKGNYPDVTAAYIRLFRLWLACRCRYSRNSFSTFRCI